MLLVPEDVLVNGLMADREICVPHEVISDLLWTPFLLQPKDDLLPLLGREVGSPTFSASSCSGIAMCQLCAVVGIVVGSIARELAADGTWSSA